MLACLFVPESTGYSTTEWIWVAVGFIGQGIFGGRLVLQWLVSERERRSVVPAAFWWMGVIGAVITLAYAIHRVDPVFIVAQAGGLLIYIRNLYFINLARTEGAAAAAGEGFAEAELVDAVIPYQPPGADQAASAPRARTAFADEPRESPRPSVAPSPDR
ncbi:MAG: lipid-A-disaccharide synthase N-terminal domain-containing protein [Planctomycetes bacterium]|nr:lipid-A-disaccharide synthase N-terminal domain-containing protein [Planctomycetota bacterium]